MPAPALSALSDISRRGAAIPSTDDTHLMSNRALLDFYFPIAQRNALHFQ
jgi:hypothetical protein